MLEEKHHIQAQEARAINLAESFLFPLIDRMIKQRQELMVSEFNGKELNMLTHTAYIAALYDLKHVLLAKQKLGNGAQEQIAQHYEGKKP